MKINKSAGLNKSEEYLSKLCEKTFLSLWSYPNIFKSPGKELCDLLVVFENDILIFSDKYCSFPKEGDLLVNWQRWFRRSVISAAEQLWGAEKYIRKNPANLFLDSKCQERFPLEIKPEKIKIHLIAVTRGVENACKKFFGGGSGSLMLKNYIVGIDNHKDPFTIGELDPKKTFIHVFDDVTLDIIMKTLDTVTDFIKYLRKKEVLIRSNMKILATGEEDLLPSYLSNIKNDEHDFDFPKDADCVALGEGTWDNFCKNPQRIAQIKVDQVSYFWDGLIERFNENTIADTHYKGSTGGVENSEKIMRFLAKEPRFSRRVLARNFLQLLQKTGPKLCGRKFSIPSNGKSPFYVFVVFPRAQKLTDDDHRKFRAEYLQACCMAIRATYSTAEDIIGIAIDSIHSPDTTNSEDAIYLDGRHWDDELQREAEKLKQKFGILKDPSPIKTPELEYPEVFKVKRNDKCPCGSNLKYKKCHGI